MSAQRDPVYWLGWDCEVPAVARGEISGIFWGKQVKYIAKQNHFKGSDTIKYQQIKKINK